MLSASSPIRFPASSSPPPPSKRPNPKAKRPAARSKPAGPFVLDDDDENEDGNDAPIAQRAEGTNENRETEDHEVPSPKRRMLQDPRGTVALQDASPEIEIPSPHTYLTPQPESLPPFTTTTQPSEYTAPLWTTNSTLLASAFGRATPRTTYVIKTCAGTSTAIQTRKETKTASYESIVAARSKTKEGRAKRSYYGIEVHELVDKARAELAAKPATAGVVPDKPLPSVEAPATGKKSKKTLLWTEKYRARNFMDLCGDDGTNRLVLRWLKKWDPVVFPGMVKSRPVINRRPRDTNTEEEKPHKKILMLTGPPGLGKTTLAHVCARQAGYEVMEVNASDDRSRDVVKNRIRTSLGTESVKTVSNRKTADGIPKAAKPACVVVDEVDGVVSGAGGSGEGGFIKALIDLVLIDQKNASGGNTTNYGRKKKGDDFRLMRPLILICNDVYHPSLRPLRQSNLAEIVHVGRPQMDHVVGRLKSVFEKEGIPCDKDAARKLCEAAWGMSSGLDAKRGAESTVEGDLRGVMVVGEWVAGRYKASTLAGQKALTKQWIENNVLHDLTSGASGSRGLGRGNVKDIVSRLFQEGGGFPKQAMDLTESKTKHEQPKTELGLGEQHKKYAMDRLREMVDTSGEISHIITEIFAEYPNREYNDDLYLTKPNEAYEWLHFHDECQSRLYASQDWELAPYLCQPVLAWHHLFASPKRHHTANPGYEKRWGGDAVDDDAEPPLPFSGARGDYQAFEAEKENRAQLQSMQSQLNPTMMRLFRSAEDMATDFLPYLVRMVSPDVKPVVVGGSQGSTASVRKESERQMVRRAAEVLAEVGVAVVKGKIESESPGTNAHFVYRMEP